MITEITTFTPAIATRISAEVREFAIQFFKAMVDECDRVEFCPEWANGTGYFNGAAEGEHAPKAANGVEDIVSFVDPFGRRGIICITPLGNSVFFERYSPSSTSPILVWNTTTAVKRLVVKAGIPCDGDLTDIEEGRDKTHFERIVNFIANEIAIPA